MILWLRAQEHVKREKHIMRECDSPFMVNLKATFSDAGSIYMLLEAVMGGELFTYLQVLSKACAGIEAPYQQYRASGSYTCQCAEPTQAAE